MPVVAVTAFAMQEDRERAFAPASTAMSRNRSASASLPEQVRGFLHGGIARRVTETATVLVVDDQPQNVRLLDAVLSPRGYRVLTAASGEEALD